MEFKWVGVGWVWCREVGESRGVLSIVVYFVRRGFFFFFEFEFRDKYCLIYLESGWGGRRVES